MLFRSDRVAFTADLYENAALFGLDRFVAEALVLFTELWLRPHRYGNRGVLSDGRYG